MVMNIALYKAFINRDLVNKLFITKMSLAKEHIRMFCNLSIYVMIIQILIKSKIFFIIIKGKHVVIM